MQVIDSDNARLAVVNLRQAIDVYNHSVNAAIKIERL
jgi:hypothetical protein